MTIEIGGASKRIGLAMSGGGFRAAAFHLGVMRKLRSVGLFDTLACIFHGVGDFGTSTSNWVLDAGSMRMAA